LNQFDTFIRYGTAADVLEKVKMRTRNFLSEDVSSLRPFGLRTYVRPEDKGDLMLFWSGGVGQYPSEKVMFGLEMINKWKTITSIRSYDHGGLPDKDGFRRVLSRIEILPPGTICTETYIVIGTFSTEDEARLLYDYLKTKFVRFLISLMSFSQDIAKKSYALVPKVELSLNWTDQKLYKFYDLSTQEVNFIETHIKDM
jgi:site-specific DNA-methyltransferase (adenine-specific)